MTNSFEAGQWHAFNRVLNHLNEYDKNAIDKKILYKRIFDMRPEETDFFQKLRQANLDRSRIWTYNGGARDLFDALELTEEAGEAAGAVKKLHRAKFGMLGNKKSEAELLANLEEEIGDVMICLEKIAVLFDIDIAEATKNKFNSKSKEVGIDIFIE